MGALLQTSAEWGKTAQSADNKKAPKTTKEYILSDRSKGGQQRSKKKKN